MLAMNMMSNKTIIEENNAYTSIYMLKEDREGYIVDKKLSNQISKFFKQTDAQTYNAIRGSLFKEQPNEKQPENSRYVNLVSLEDPTHILEVQPRDLKKLQKEEGEILLAVPSANDRYEIHENEDLMKDALESKIGVTDVKVEINAREYGGTLKYKGPLKKHRGTYFGVELKVNTIFFHSYSKKFSHGQISYGILFEPQVHPTCCSLMMLLLVCCLPRWLMTVFPLKPCQMFGFLLH